VPRRHGGGVPLRRATAQQSLRRRRQPTPLPLRTTMAMAMAPATAVARGQQTARAAAEVRRGAGVVRAVQRLPAVVPPPRMGR